MCVVPPCPAKFPAIVIFHTCVSLTLIIPFFLNAEFRLKKKDSYPSFTILTLILQFMVLPDWSEEIIENFGSSKQYKLRPIWYIHRDRNVLASPNLHVYTKYIEVINFGSKQSGLNPETWLIQSVLISSQTLTFCQSPSHTPWLSGKALQGFIVPAV